MFGEGERLGQGMEAKRGGARHADLVSSRSSGWSRPRSSLIDEWAQLASCLGHGAPTLQNYRIVFAPMAAREFAAKQAGSLDYKVSGSAWKAFEDSAIIAVSATILSVVFGTLAAWSIVRFRTGGDNYPFQFLTVRMFPPIAVVVPMVVLFSIVRLSDTYFGLIARLHRLHSAVQHLDDPQLHRGGAGGAGGRGDDLRHGPVRSLPQGDAAAHQGRAFRDGALHLHPQLVGVPVRADADGGRRGDVTVQVANYVSASSGKLYGVQAAMGTVSTLPVIFFGYIIQRHLVRGLTFGAIKR